MRYLTEKLKTPVRYECDVFVAGGGIAGVAAALAAARQGKRVILADRGFLLGGIATAGLVAIYLPIADGYGKQASTGLAEELLRVNLAHGAVDRFPKQWELGGMTKEDYARNHHVSIEYNPQVFAILLEELLLKEKVQILYGTTVCAVDAADERIHAVMVENKSGRSATAVQAVVDATGDADLFAMAGAETRLSSEPNTLAAWYYYQQGQDRVKLKIHGAADAKEESTELVPETFGGVDAEEISHMVTLAHKAVLQDVEQRGKDGDIQLTNIATIPQLRMTRQIVGAVEMSEAEGAGCEDSIGLVASWRKRGEIYHIPFRALYGKEYANLLTAGRSLSANPKMWDLCRVIPGCATTGEAAGIAAAMGVDVRTMDVRQLQKRLMDQGVQCWL